MQLLFPTPTFFKEIYEQLEADKPTGQKGINKKQVWSLNAQTMRNTWEDTLDRAAGIKPAGSGCLR